MTGEADWAYLPKLVAYSFLDKLFEPVDRIRFGAVCTNWHQIVEDYIEDRSVHKNLKKQLPMLMIPATNNHHKRRLYSIFEKKLYPIHLSVPNEICIGSYYNGWLAFANHKTYVISLMNPFKNGDPINLPPIEFNHFDRAGSSFKIKKVILSADPFVSPNNYVVLVIYGGDGKLAFIKSGKNKWVKLDLEIDLFTDVVSYKNMFYAVTNYSRIISLDLSVDDYDKPVQVNVLTEGDGSRVPRVYLVESSKGDLLMVLRYFAKNKVEKGKVRITKSFNVYKLDMDATSGELIERVDRTSLDGDAAFIGFNYSCSVCTSEFSKCDPNSIYFTNDFFQLYNLMDGACGAGVYNMEEKSFKDHRKLEKSEFLFKPCIWVFPPTVE